MNHPENTEPIDSQPPTPRGKPATPNLLIRHIKELFILCMSALSLQGCTNNLNSRELGDKVNKCLGRENVKQRCEDPEEFVSWAFQKCDIETPETEIEIPGANSKTTSNKVTRNVVDFLCRETIYRKIVKECLASKEPGNLRKTCSEPDTRDQTYAGMFIKGPSSLVPWVFENCKGLRSDVTAHPIDIKKTTSVWAKDIVEFAIKEVCSTLTDSNSNSNSKKPINPQ